MERIAIVVVAYNRVGSLMRLLDSLTGAYYPEGVDVPLIISVDKSDSPAVEDIAKDYVWEHGDKEVRLHETNLGLKEHVLECGDISGSFDGVIVLEDDLYVSPSFYMYTLAAFSRTRMEKKIGGISLYSHRLNVHAREPFEAIDDGYDNYYMQFASSWGQAFTTEQWGGFRKWYDIHSQDDIASDDIPVNVSTWSDKSWLKYYIKYLVDTDKYFLYPRVSFTTNFGDEGEHMAGKDMVLNDLQVPLAGIRKYGQIDFHFSDIDESGSVYDAFFENMRLKHRLPAASDGDVSIDMYGIRQASGYKRYVLSSKALPYRILESYGRRLRPIDANVLYKIEGKDFFLYDTEKPGKAPRINDVRRYLYNYRAIKAREMTAVLGYRLKSRFSFSKKPVKKPVTAVSEAVPETASQAEAAAADIMTAETVDANIINADSINVSGTDTENTQEQS